MGKYVRARAPPPPLDPPFFSLVFYVSLKVCAYSIQSRVQLVVVVQSKFIFFLFLGDALSLPEHVRSTTRSAMDLCVTTTSVYLSSTDAPFSFFQLLHYSLILPYFTIRRRDDSNNKKANRQRRNRLIQIFIAVPSIDGYQLLDPFFFLFLVSQKDFVLKDSDGKHFDHLPSSLFFLFHLLMWRERKRDTHTHTSVCVGEERVPALAQTRASQNDPTKIDSNRVAGWASVFQIFLLCVCCCCPGVVAFERQTWMWVDLYTSRKKGKKKKGGRRGSL